MGFQSHAAAKFRLIEKAVSHDNNLLSISAMCEISGVSRSGYYNWPGKVALRQEREYLDKADFKLVLAAFKFRGYSKGAMGVP